MRIVKQVLGTLDDVYVSAAEADADGWAYARELIAASRVAMTIAHARMRR